MACEKKNPQKKKYGFFSLTEIDAAKLLLELSNSTTYLDENCHSNSSNNVTVQWKTQQSDDISPSSPTDSVEDVLAEIEEDERLRRKKKRFRYVEEVYKVTDPMVIVPPFNKN